MLMTLLLLGPILPASGSIRRESGNLYQAPNTPSATKIKKRKQEKCENKFNRNLFDDLSARILVRDVLGLGEKKLGKDLLPYNLWLTILEKILDEVISAINTNDKSYSHSFSDEENQVYLRPQHNFYKEDYKYSDSRADLAGNELVAGQWTNWRERNAQGLSVLNLDGRIDWSKRRKVVMDLITVIQKKRLIRLLFRHSPTVQLAAAELLESKILFRQEESITNCNCFAYYFPPPAEKSNFHSGRSLVLKWKKTDEPIQVPIVEYLVGINHPKQENFFSAKLSNDQVAHLLHWVKLILDENTERQGYFCQPDFPSLDDHFSDPDAIGNLRGVLANTAAKTFASFEQLLEQVPIILREIRYFGSCESDKTNPSTTQLSSTLPTALGNIVRDYLPFLHPPRTSVS